jgi:TetR/AcrR family fatty acid metabolism transcriptional regulator
MSHPGESDKRQQILKAAVKVFSRKGFHDAKVDEIAQLADVGKGTVYEYFSSKTEVFQEMFKAGMQFYVDNISKELKPELSCQEKLRRVAKLHIRFITHYKDLARITMTEHTQFNEEFRNWIFENRSRKMKMLEQIIDEGIASGEIRKVDSQAVAMVFSGVLGAMCSPIICSGQKANPKELSETVMDIVFHGIVNKDKQRGS